MPVNSLLTTTISAGVPLYRITDVAYSVSRSQYKQVVNGMGARRSPTGGRYNHPGVVTIYLAADFQTCFAEKLFYFLQEVALRLDSLHLPMSRGVPAFSGTFTLWEVRLKKAIADVCHLTHTSASAVGVIPSLTVNPSQDYEHLKERRAFIESQGYKGIRAPSSRSTTAGEIIALFDDQSKNAELSPYTIEFRLIGQTGAAFGKHLIDLLDSTAGEVRFVGAAPHGVKGYANWTKVSFRH